MTASSYDASESLTVEPQLAFQFFITFARFEYAVIHAGYLLDKPYAVADWHRLAETLAPEISKVCGQNLRSAIDYYNKYPPQRLDRHLKWESFEPSRIHTLSHEGKAIRWVPQVRNNFFHGIKTSGYLQIPHRDHDLMTYGLSIIHACLNADDGLRKLYLEL